MTEQPTRRIAIVGAGASGVLLANALAKAGPVLFEVVLLDPRISRGPAYGVQGEHLLLNTRAGAMSLDPASPSGFVDWLNTYRPKDGPWTASDFAPRRLYGGYLQQRLSDLEARTPGLGSTRWIAARVTAMARQAEGWRLHLASGERLTADAVVLASGVNRPRPLLFHGREAVEAYVQDDPWDEAGLRSARSGPQVLIAGAGPSFADVAQSLWKLNPDLRIVAISRHGLAPRIHGPPGAGAPIFSTGYPTTARELFARLGNAAGFVEGDPEIRPSRLAELRSHGACVWAALPPEERQMFMRHYRTYWDVERHRLPPELGQELRAAVKSGRLELLRGRIAEAKPLKGGTAARVAVITHSGPRAIAVSRIVNCTGPEADPYRSRNALLLDLLAQGLVSADSLGLGLRVDEHSSAIGASGETTPGLYAMGALTLGRFFEITGVPEIRAQAQRLAAVLAQGAPARTLAAWMTA